MLIVSSDGWVLFFLFFGSEHGRLKALQALWRRASAARLRAQAAASPPVTAAV